VVLGARRGSDSKHKGGNGVGGGEKKTRHRQRDTQREENGRVRERDKFYVRKWEIQESERREREGILERSTWERRTG